MYRKTYSLILGFLFPTALLASLFMAGCSKNQTPTDGPVAANGPGGGPTGGPGGGPGRNMGGPGGGPGAPGGGRRRGRGQRFAPVAVTATAAEIFPQKCARCHGDNGEGARGPKLTMLAGDSDDDLFKTIHNGKGRMPAFANQMTDAQIKLLVTYVKGLGTAK